MSVRIVQRKDSVYIRHFDKVELDGIQAQFFADRQHRATLLIPFVDRKTGRTICVIGQNPSEADEQNADKTIRYLEQYIFERLPQYDRMLMLNLYSRVDTRKIEASNLNHQSCEQVLRSSIAAHQDFLMVFGQLKNQRSYRFPERVRELKPAFEGKRVHKLDIGTTYAPHPGNSAILYHNFVPEIAPYDFGDVTKLMATVG